MIHSSHPRFAVPLILFLLASFTSLAQDQRPDSLPAQELNEVVVQVQRQRTSATATTYTPTGRQKNASNNALDLLRQMGIPQIRVNPTTDAVTDNTGAAVSIFINYLPASAEEKDGLRTADVRRVEYLEYPTDPRFRGAERVINFIVQEYAYGGYTKFTGIENALTGLSSQINVFSKFSFKKMTFDLYAGANNTSHHHSGANTTGIYHLTDDQDQPLIVTRTETTESSSFKQNQYPLSFRATYNTEKVQIRNQLGFTSDAQPVNEYSGALAYSPAAASGYRFESQNPNRSNALSYEGTYFFTLPRGFSLNFSPSFVYSHSNDYTRYTSTDQATINRHARENYYFYRFDLDVRKRIGEKHSLSLSANSGNRISRLCYDGDYDYRDKFQNPFEAGKLSYNFKTKKFTLYLDGGVCWERSEINGQPLDDTYPFVHASLRFAPSSKSVFSAYAQYASSSPGLSDKSTDILRSNELMYITGNPALKNCRHTTFSLSYTWFPSNAFNMSAYTYWSTMYDRFLLSYAPYDGGRAIIRQYINDGNFTTGELGLSFNLTLLDGKLQIYATPSLYVYRSTGIYDKTYCPFYLYTVASYYLGNVYFNLFYETPDRYISATVPRISKTRNYHAISVGWGNSSWNIRLSAVNILNKGWRTGTLDTASPYYAETQDNFGTTSHARLNLRVTYTFGYGKKLNRDNELGTSATTSTAILK